MVNATDSMQRQQASSWIEFPSGSNSRQETLLNQSDSNPSDEEPQSRVELYIVIVLLSIMSLIGTSGNALVLCVFSKKREEKVVSTLLIIALAVVDFITCLVVIPYTIFMESVDFRVYNDITCKIYQFLITSNVPFSALIMVVIAIDRYLCICHPFLRAFTVSRVKVVITALALCAATMGLCVALMFGVYHRKQATLSSLPVSSNMTTEWDFSRDVFTAQLENLRSPKDSFERTQVFAALGKNTAVHSVSNTGTSNNTERQLSKNSVVKSTFNPSVNSSASTSPSNKRLLQLGTTPFALITNEPWRVEDNRHSTHYSVQPSILDQDGQNISQNYHMSSASEELENIGNCLANDLIISQDFQFYYQKLYTAMYPACLGIVIVLYVLIYRSVLTRRSKRQMQKSKTLAVVESLTTTTTTLVDSRNSGSYQEVQQVEPDNIITESPKKPIIECEHGKPKRSSKRRPGSQKHRMTKAESTRLANLKTAAMLFVVTVVFVVTFLPAFLMVLNIVPHNVIVFYLYFANNVANPVIYSFMNQNFRNDLFKLVSGRR